MVLFFKVFTSRTLDLQSKGWLAGLLEVPTTFPCKLYLFPLLSMKHSDLMEIAEKGGKKWNKDKKLTKVIVKSFPKFPILKNLGFLLPNLAQVVEKSSMYCTCMSAIQKISKQKVPRKSESKEDLEVQIKKFWLVVKLSNELIQKRTQRWNSRMTIQKKQVIHNQRPKFHCYIDSCRVKNYS